jgi:hypothetical protein
MARAVKRHLKVGATPHLDENKLIVRMHETDAPEGVKWGNYISLSANQNRIACKVLSNAMAEVKPPREHQISVNKHLKSKLHIKPGTTVDFYIKKASPLTYSKCWESQSYWPWQPPSRRSTSWYGSRGLTQIVFSIALRPARLDRLPTRMRPRLCILDRQGDVS